MAGSGPKFNPVFVTSWAYEDRVQLITNAVANSVLFISVYYMIMYLRIKLLEVTVSEEQADIRKKDAATLNGFIEYSV